MLDEQGGEGEEGEGEGGGGGLGGEVGFVLGGVEVEEVLEGD